MSILARHGYRMSHLHIKKLFGNDRAEAKKKKKCMSGNEVCAHVRKLASSTSLHGGDALPKFYAQVAGIWHAPVVRVCLSAAEV